MEEVGLKTAFGDAVFGEVGGEDLDGHGRIRPCVKPVIMPVMRVSCVLSQTVRRGAPPTCSGCDHALANVMNT